ncbi:MAG TPA: metallophosphoesterase [Sandaracinaceae bacterium]
MHSTVAAVVLALLAGCVPNESGRLAARSTGQLLHPGAPRTHATAALRAVCGEPATTSAPILRAPYLQSVSTDRATVVWTSNGGANAIEVWNEEDSSRERIGSVRASTRFLAGAEQREARITGLEPGTVYCYEVLDTAGRRVAGPYGFRTAPEPDAAERVDIVVFGDSGGGGPDQFAVAEQLTTVPIDFVLHTGDVAYGSGTLEELEAKYFDVYEPWLASLPVFPASGNHDYVTADLGPYREVFVLPDNGGQAGRERWYSFDWGPVHVVVLDTQRNDPAQVEFLERDLANTDRPWRIVVAHWGPYSSGPHGPNGAFRELYEPILARYGVQVVFTGHDHHYERTRPMNGITYIVTGGGGMSTRPVTPNPAWTEMAEDVMHFVYVSIEGDLMRVHAIDATGREFDGVEIRR